MKVQSQSTLEKAFIVHATDETDAIHALIQRSPEALDVRNYSVVRIRRTFWQRFVNSAPRWKVTYTVDANQTESSTR